ncbi:MAG: hypothetical protein CW716_03420 [Candidatus Bathyarchaeum sp.]|nr:MAG: hypothetical protein CW716_03420 [Candidatus Bathyarchaeum sp.]
MVKRSVLLVVAVVVVVLSVSLVLVYLNADYSNKTKHETPRWVVITDSKNDVISVETSDPEPWRALGALYKTQTQLWIGGTVEDYDNYWGFRFDPDTIVVAEVTVEGAQSTIRAISEDLDYWKNTWQKQVYVLATVIEVHSGLDSLDF